MRITPTFYLTLLVCVGCAQIPQHEKATVATSAECDTLAEGMAVGEWPKEKWWKDCHDPVLNQLIESGLALSPTLKIAEERLKSANQAVIQVKSSLYPEVDFTISDNWQHLSKNGFFRSFAKVIPAVVNDLTLGFSFSYEFDFWGKNRDLFHAALGVAVARAAETLQAELIMTTTIAYSYTQLQFMLLQKRLLEKKEANQGMIDEMRMKRMQHGLDPAQEQLVSYGSVLDIQTALIALDQGIALEVHRLKELSGQSQDAAIEVSYTPLSPLIVSIPEELSLDLLARRPDLVAQRALVESAGKEINAAKTNFYPNINLMGLIGLETVHWTSIFQKDNYSATINPALHLPIFTAGRIKAHLMQKVADFNTAVYHYNETILLAAREVADGISDIILLQKQADVRKKSLYTAREQEALSLLRFENALDDRMTYLHTQNLSLDRELQLADLEYSKQLAAILLIRALGGGLHEE